MSRVDRRALFTSGAAAALLAVTGVSMHAAPERGGRLRIAVARDGSLDLVARRAVFDGLTEVGPDGLVQGELAARWTVSPDARDWRFDLREGVSFHDGRALRAGDVVASLERGGLPGTVMRDGPTAVAIRLDRSNPDLPLLLADPAWSVTQDGAQDGWVGTGLYRMTGWREGRQFIGQRSAPHYKDGQAGWPDAIEIIAIPDARVRVEALRDGYVDVAALPDMPDGLAGADIRMLPSQAAVAGGVGVPAVVSSLGPLDDGRIAERWWLRTA